MRYLGFLIIAGMVALFVWNALPMLDKNLPKEQAHGCYSNEEFGTFSVRKGGIDYQGKAVFTRYHLAKGDREGEKFLITAPHLRFTPAGKSLAVDIVKDGQSAQQYLQWVDNGQQAILLIPVNGVPEPVPFTRSACPA